MARTWNKVTYVDQDGVIYTKEELKNYMFKRGEKHELIIHKKTHERTIIDTTVEIKIRGKKPKQLELF